VGGDGRASRAKQGRAPRLHGAAAQLAATTAARLADIGARYPGCWATLERMRGLGAEMGWPAWCWVPMSGAHAVVGGGQQMAGDDPRAADIAVVSALAACQGRGIYHVGPELAEALAGTDLVGALPVDVLYRPPEWCVYISGMGTDAYAHLEWDVTHRRPELRLLMSGIDGWVSVAVHLDRPTLAEAIESMLAQAKANAAGTGTCLDIPTTAWPSSWPLPGLSWPPCSTCARRTPTSSTPTAPGRRHDGPWRPVRPRGCGRWATGWRPPCAGPGWGPTTMGGPTPAPGPTCAVPTVWATPLHCLSSVAHGAVGQRQQDEGDSVGEGFGGLLWPRRWTASVAPTGRTLPLASDITANPTMSAMRIRRPFHMSARSPRGFPGRGIDIQKWQVVRQCCRALPQQIVERSVCRRVVEHLHRTGSTDRR